MRWVGEIDFSITNSQIKMKQSRAELAAASEKGECEWGLCCANNTTQI